jgi:hypothetical protein
MQIPLSKNVTLSMMVHLLFAATSNLHISISITFSCVSINAYTFVDGYIVASTTASSPSSICAAYASIDYCSIASFSSNFSMNIGSTNIAHDHVCTLAH